jgi:hypothetical protein
MLKDLDINLITPAGLLFHQSEWVQWCSKFEGMEKEFFKPYWVSIDSSFDYFIDMSDSSFPVFEPFYDCIHEPYHWKKQFLCHNIAGLMMAEDCGIDMKEVMTNHVRGKIRQICKSAN